jgi:ferredoxin
MIGHEIAPRDEAKFRELQDKLEAVTPDERAKYFEGHFSRCIRCFACVKACPMCYCTTCFAIQDKPQYIPRMVGLDENRMFHLGRAMHLAGRCVGCGACDRACPVDIPLRALNTKLASETKDLFGIEAGLSMDQKPPLVEFLPGDTEEVLDKAE